MADLQPVYDKTSVPFALAPFPERLRAICNAAAALNLAALLTPDDAVAIEASLQDGILGDTISRGVRAYIRVDAFGMERASPGVVEIWPPRSSSAIHEHNGNYAVIIPLFGECTLLTFERVNGGHPTGEYALRAPSNLVAVMTPNRFQIHQIHNRTDRACVTLQIYANEDGTLPPHERFLFRDLNGDIQRFENPESDFVWGSLRLQLRREHRQREQIAALERQVEILQRPSALSRIFPLPADPTGFSSAPVHLKTNWRFAEGVNTMYHVSLRGYHFRGGKPFNIECVGYLYGITHCYESVQSLVTGSSVTAQAYRARDDFLAFRLTATADWHASTLTCEFLPGGTQYMQLGASTFEISAIVHSQENLWGCETLSTIFFQPISCSADYITR